DDIAGGRRVGDDASAFAVRPCALLDEVEFAPGERPFGGVERQAPGEGSARGQAPGLLVRRQRSAAEGFAGAVRRARGLLRDLLAGPEAAIGEVIGGEGGESGVVIVDVLGLATDRGLPRDPQPGEILIYRRLEL